MDRVLLSDFGLVRTIENTSKQQSLKTEELVGTAAYMAPEHIVGRKPRPRSDVFALAVMVYLWVSGEYPFKGDGEMIAGQHMRELSPPPLHRGSKTFRPKLKRLFSKVWQIIQRNALTPLAPLLKNSRMPGVKMKSKLCKGK